MELLNAFQYPFMQRALVAGVVLSVTLGALGVFATLRRMAFMGEGVAHASLFGIAVALLCGWAPLPIALLWGVCIALFLHHLERRSRLPTDTVMGILFTSSMAGGVVLMSFTKGFQPELLSYLFGNILAIRPLDVWAIVLMGSAIIAWLFWAKSRLLLLSLSEDMAVIAGIRPGRSLLFLYVALACAIVLGVKILGIVLISALLILPPATSRLFANSFARYFYGTMAYAALFVSVGLCLSYVFDIPSGASIVLIGALTFALSTFISRR